LSSFEALCLRQRAPWLQYAITEYPDHRIADRETFRLDKVGEQILEKVAGAKQAF